MALVASAEERLRQLAAADASLIADLGSSPFRWFDRQLGQGVLQPGKTCVRVIRISTMRRYVQGNGAVNTNLSPLETPRFQIDVLDFNAETARKVAADVVAFLGTICLANNGQFDSPAISPVQYPNFLLSQRARMDFQLSKTPAYVECLDVRLYNLQSFV